MIYLGLYPLLSHLHLVTLVLAIITLDLVDYTEYLDSFGNISIFKEHWCQPRVCGIKRLKCLKYLKYLFICSN